MILARLIVGLCLTSSVLAEPVLEKVLKAKLLSTESYPQETKDLPIGIFDSGIGGLTVLEAILGLDEFDNKHLRPGSDGKPDFENERFIYFGDQANMPYGNYPAVGKTDFLRELILRDVTFLLGDSYYSDRKIRRDKPAVKAIVIACNTATAYGLQDIREAIKAWNIPVFVVGVVEAGAKGLVDQLPNELTDSTVAVYATVGTCSSEAYPKAIQRISGQAGKSAPFVLQQGSKSLAGAIEGDPQFLANGESIQTHMRKDLVSLLDHFKQQKRKAPIQKLVLGCTHFPLVREQILEELSRLRKVEGNREVIADKIDLVDPAELTAKELFKELVRHGLRRTQEAEVPHQFFISIPNVQDPAAEVLADGTRLDPESQYSREPGNPERTDTIVVPMRLTFLPTSSQQLIKNHLPHVDRAMKGD